MPISASSTPMTNWFATALRSADSIAARVSTRVPSLRAR